MVATVSDQQVWRLPEREQMEDATDVPEASDLALEDINPLNPHLFRENRWQSHFSRLRAEDPVHFNELESSGRYWSLTKYDDIRNVNSDWKRFSSASGFVLGPPVGAKWKGMSLMQSSFISMDPPTHTEQRRTVKPVSSPPNLREMEPIIRERTAAVLDALPEGETFDWVDTVSVELTTLMLATLLGFPIEDRRKLTRWSDIVFAVPEPGGVIESGEQKIAELMECGEYFSRLFDQRRADPGDDLVSMLVHGEDTKHLSAFDLLGTILLLIIGGNDTTRNAMTGSVYGLNKYPEQYDRLNADPSLIASMAPEIIRWQTPLSYMRRTANEDCEIGGKQIRKNDQVLMWYISGNRDESIFANGDAIDISRENAFRHLSFGTGIHYCVGSRLAELQLRILWEEIHERFERIEVQSEPERTASSFVHGYTRLDVQLTRSAS